MWYLLRDIIWHKWKGAVIAVITLLTTYSAIIENVFPDVGLPTMKDLLSGWDWWVWALIGLVVLCVVTFVSAYQQNRQLQSHDNWIVAHKARHGKLPPLPESLLPLVDNYTAGEPISKKIKVKTSLQYWHGLTDDNRERFLRLINWKGEDRHDYLQNMRDTAPPGGSATTQLVYRKRKEE